MNAWYRTCVLDGLFVFQQEIGISVPFAIFGVTQTAGKMNEEQEGGKERGTEPGEGQGEVLWNDRTCVLAERKGVRVIPWGKQG